MFGILLAFIFCIVVIGGAYFFIFSPSDNEDINKDHSNEKYNNKFWKIGRWLSPELEWKFKEVYSEKDRSFVYVYTSESGDYKFQIVKEYLYKLNIFKINTNVNPVWPNDTRLVAKIQGHSLDRMKEHARHCNYYLNKTLEDLTEKFSFRMICDRNEVHEVWECIYKEYIIVITKEMNDRYNFGYYHYYVTKKRPITTLFNSLFFKVTTDKNKIYPECVEFIEKYEKHLNEKGNSNV